MSVSSKVIQLDSIKKGNISGDHIFLENTKQWVNSFSDHLDSEDFEELDQTNGSNVKFTHTGLVYYLHLCWSQEVGVCLRPDMLWFTVVSELADMVNGSPNDFKHLFTDSEEKTNIITITHDVTDIDIGQLVDQLKNKIKNEALSKLITETTFESSVDGFQEAIMSAFAYMAVPYFNYMTTMCGIPHLELQGSIEDWTKLLDSINNLNNILGDKSDEPNFARMRAYFSNITSITEDIIKYSFNEPDSKEAKIFFNNIFHYGENERCQSGHDSVIAKGWITKFYIINGNKDLYKYNKHLNCVPYQNSETKRQFCKFTGLTYSTYDEDANIFYPQYGKVKYEIHDKSAFKKLSKQ